LYHGGDHSQFSDDEQDDVYVHTRDWIGEVLNVSGRHVSRLLAVLDAPPAVQRAYDERRLSLQLAAKIANRSPDVQAAIAEAIERGGDPKKVAMRFLRRRRLPNGAEKLYTKIVTGLAEAAEVFKDDFSEICMVDVVDEVLGVA
jgi:ParB-like chromosome segregation protein Spo0J